MKLLGAVLAATTLAAAPPDSASPLGPYSRLLVFGECLNEIATGVDELMDGGLSGFLVFGLPNLGRLPDVVGTPAAARVIQAALAFNATLQQLSALQRCERRLLRDFDDRHPTEAVHSMYAGAIRARLVPVPLPATLPLAATGLVLLLGFRIRGH